jgi:hypothetical protein
MHFLNAINGPFYGSGNLLTLTKYVIQLSYMMPIAMMYGD